MPAGQPERVVCNSWPSVAVFETLLQDPQRTMTMSWPAECWTGHYRVQSWSESARVLERSEQRRLLCVQMYTTTGWQPAIIRVDNASEQTERQTIHLEELD